MYELKKKYGSYSLFLSFHLTSKIFQSFFGFGQSAEIAVVLDGAESRKQADIKTEDGKKERHLLYYDGESVSGKVSFLSV